MLEREEEGFLGLLFGGKNEGGKKERKERDKKTKRQKTTHIN